MDISLTTSGSRPLHVFGGNASDTVSALLRAAGIDVHCSTTAEMPGDHRLVLGRTGGELHPQRTVTLHQLTGPDVQGIPGDAVHRFICIDQHSRVRNTDGHIFAAGDATDFPVKHGGVSAQQADTAADAIAHLAKAGPSSKPLHPVLRATLVTGGEPLYLSAHIIAGQGWSAEIFERPPWTPGEKVVAQELGSYLRTVESASHGTAAS